MKVYMNKRNNFSISEYSKNTKNSILNEIYSKQKKNKEIIIEEKINNIGNDIKQKISQGKDIHKISLSEVKDLDTIIEFILNKNSRKINDILILRQFLMSFSNLLEILSLDDKFNDTSDLIYKISSSLKKEEIPKNEILFLNGQLGKTFYIILKGEVSVLIPMQYCVQITCSQFYQYMEFLLENKEYELIRLSFASNEKILKERNIQNLEQYEKFLGLLNSNISANASFDTTEIDAYMNKFTTFVNKILEENKKLEEERKKIEEEKKKENESEEEIEEEEEETEEKKNNEDDDLDSFDITINKNEKKKKGSKKKEEENFDENKFIYIKYKFFLWKYNIVCNLEKGKTFGEVALKKGDNRRTATIITKTDCIFGILEKDDYQASIKEFMEKARKINTEAIMNSKLFHKYREDLFDSHYFNCFKAIKKYKGDYLFKQNEERKYIYFIKKGDVQIEYYSSWNELDKILEILGNKKINDKKTLKDLIFSNEKLEIFSQKKQKFNISIYSSGEILGLEEHIYPDSDIFMFSTVCLSECDIFSLEIQFIEKMMNEKILRNNYNKLIAEKKEKLIQRLLNLKSNILYQYNNMIEDKNIYLINNNNDNKVNEKYKNILKTKEKLFFLKPQIKEEINNYSLEKKNLKKDLLKLNIQNKKNDNSLLSSTNMKKKEESLILSNRRNLFRLNSQYENEGYHSLRESKVKIYSVNQNLFKLSNDILNFKIKQKYKTLKQLKINREKAKTQRISSLPKKTEIKFSIKGRVPNLLYDTTNTVNKVIDKLLSKEKDLYNNFFSENRINEKKENDKEKNNKTPRKFISHLDILGFDKLVDKIALNTKKKYGDNKTENSKNIGKIKLFPYIKNNNKYFNMK